MNGGFFMIYLDYAANTPVNPKVLKVFNDATLTYFGNPNSLHKNFSFCETIRLQVISYEKKRSRTR